MAAPPAPVRSASFASFTEWGRDMQVTCSSERARRLGVATLFLTVAIGCGGATPVDPSPPPPAPQTTVPPVPPPSPQPGLPAVSPVFLAAPVDRPSSGADRVVGRYALEIEAGSPSGSRCALMPEYALRRTFTADVHSLGDRYAVKLYDASFLADSARVGYGCRDARLPQDGHAVCHQLLLTGNVDALTATMWPEDEWRGSEIWESLPDGFLLAIQGIAAGEASDGRIDLVGTGSFWYGNSLPASTSYSCQANPLRLTFRPQ